MQKIITIMKKQWLGLIGMGLCLFSIIALLITLDPIMIVYTPIGLLFNIINLLIHG